MVILYVYVFVCYVTMSVVFSYISRKGQNNDTIPYLCADFVVTNTSSNVIDQQQHLLYTAKDTGAFWPTQMSLSVVLFTVVAAVQTQTKKNQFGVRWSCVFGIEGRPNMTMTVDMNPLNTTKEQYPKRFTVRAQQSMYDTHNKGYNGNDRRTLDIHANYNKLFTDIVGILMYKLEQSQVTQHFKWNKKTISSIKKSIMLQKGFLYHLTHAVQSKAKKSPTTNANIHAWFNDFKEALTKHVKNNKRQKTNNIKYRRGYYQIWYNSVLQASETTAAAAVMSGRGQKRPQQDADVIIITSSDEEDKDDSEINTPLQISVSPKRSRVMKPELIVLESDDSDIDNEKTVATTTCTNTSTSTSTATSTSMMATWTPPHISDSNNSVAVSKNIHMYLGTGAIDRVKKFKQDYQIELAKYDAEYKVINQIKDFDILKLKMPSFMEMERILSKYKPLITNAMKNLDKTRANIVLELQDVDDYMWTLYFGTYQPKDERVEFFAMCMDPAMITQKKERSDVEDYLKDITLHTLHQVADYVTSEKLEEMSWKTFVAKAHNLDVNHRYFEQVGYDFQLRGLKRYVKEGSEFNGVGFYVDINVSIDEYTAYFENERERYMHKQKGEQQLLDDAYQWACLFANTDNTKNTDALPVVKVDKIMPAAAHAHAHVHTHQHIQVIERAMKTKGIPEDGAPLSVTQLWPITNHNEKRFHQILLAKTVDGRIYGGVGVWREGYTDLHGRRQTKSVMMGISTCKAIYVAKHLYPHIKFPSLGSMLLPAVHGLAKDRGDYAFRAQEPLKSMLSLLKKAGVRWEGYQYMLPVSYADRYWYD